MSDISRPRLSVVIPCYNESAHIPATLRSLKHQDFPGEYEIIVVDNNSTDGTAGVAKQFGVRVVKEKRAGVCYARQKGSEMANGEIIVSTDADTTFQKDWLTKIDDVFKQNSRVVAVAGPFHYTGGPVWAIYTRIIFGYTYYRYKLTGRVTYAPGANLAFKKSAWDGYNTTMTQYGDEMDLLRKLKRKGKVVFKKDIYVKTSPRRLEHGLLYNIVFSFFIYSLLEYNLNRLFKRRFFGQAPAFRDNIDG